MRDPTTKQAGPLLRVLLAQEVPAAEEDALSRAKQHPRHINAGILRRPITRTAGAVSSRQSKHPQAPASFMIAPQVCCLFTGKLHRSVANSSTFPTTLCKTHSLLATTHFQKHVALLAWSSLALG